MTRARFKLTGDLTIHGVTREVTLDVVSEGRGKDPWGGERAGFSAHAKIKRSDFGLTWNQVLEAGGFAVGDEVKIALDVEAVEAVVVVSSSRELAVESSSDTDLRPLNCKLSVRTKPDPKSTCGCRRSERLAEVARRQGSDVAGEVAVIGEVLHLHVERQAVAAGARRGALRRRQRAAFRSEVDAAGHLHRLAERPASS